MTIAHTLGFTRHLYLDPPRRNIRLCVSYATPTRWSEVQIMALAEPWFKERHRYGLRLPGGIRAVSGPQKKRLHPPDIRRTCGFCSQSEMPILGARSQGEDALTGELGQVPSFPFCFYPALGIVFKLC